MKRILMLLLCTALVLCLCCCKKDEDINTPGDDEINQEEQNENNEQALPEVMDVTYNVTLYFPDNDALYLHPEDRKIVIKSNESIEMKIIEELISGPKAENRWAAVEGENLVNSAVTDEKGLCTIDLKKDFEILNSGGTTREAFVFGSIVNSLCSLESVECVKFNVDGDTAYEYGGHSVLDSAFYPQLDLVAK